MNTEKISVIIPCYNAEQYIDRCLTSVVRQTIGLSSIEIIAVDDASADRTLFKLLQWEEKYKENLMVIALEQNSGLGTVRNVALSYATGDYLFFLDSDDWIALNTFERLISVKNPIDKHLFK